MAANIIKFLNTEFGYTPGFSTKNSNTPRQTKIKWHFVHNMYYHIIEVWPKLVELNKECGHQTMYETIYCVLEIIAGSKGEPWPVFEKTDKMLSSTHNQITNYGYVHKARITLQGYLLCMFMTIKKYHKDIELGRTKGIFQILFADDIIFTFLFDRMEIDPKTGKSVQFVHVYIPEYIRRLGEIRSFKNQGDSTIHKLHCHPSTIETVADYKNNNIVKRTHDSDSSAK